MSSCTQLTLLSRSTTRSLSYSTQLSSGRQSASSLSIKPNNGRLASVVVEQNPLPVQQFRPFSSFASPLISSNFNLQPRHKPSPKPASPAPSTTDSHCSSTMSHNRLKQLKQVYSSNLYLFQCLAFIGFVLLTVRLYEVNKDINYLRHVSGAWLPNITVVPVDTSAATAAESAKVSTTVSMFTDKITDASSPLASPLTSSLVPTFEDEDEDNEESESRLTTQSIRFVTDSIESLPQPQALQFRSRTPSSRSTTPGLSSSRSNGLTTSNASRSHSSTTAGGSSSTSGLSSSTSNTTPLSTQVDNIQREIDLAKARSAYFHVENLRKDVDSLIGKCVCASPMRILFLKILIYLP